MLEQVHAGSFEKIPFENFLELATSRTPEKIKALLKEEAEKRKAERERLRALEAERQELNNKEDQRKFG